MMDNPTFNPAIRRGEVLRNYCVPPCHIIYRNLQPLPKEKSWMFHEHQAVFGVQKSERGVPTLENFEISETLPKARRPLAGTKDPTKGEQKPADRKRSAFLNLVSAYDVILQKLIRTAIWVPGKDHF